MPLRILCPKCRHKLSVPEEFAGKTGRCPSCQQSFPVVPPLEGWPDPAGDVPVTVPPPRHPTTIPATAAGPPMPPEAGSKSLQPAPHAAKRQAPPPIIAEVPTSGPGIMAASPAASIIPPLPPAQPGENPGAKTSGGQSGGCAAMVVAALVAVGVVLKKSGPGVYVLSKLARYGLINPKTHDTTVQILIVAVVAFLFVLAIYWSLRGINRLVTLLAAPTTSPTPPPLVVGQISSGSPATFTATPQCQSAYPPSDTAPQGQDGAMLQWWLSCAGQVNGPYATTAIVSQARAGQLAVGTQVCQAGGTQWAPLTDWLRRQNAAGIM